jgi:DNA-directed RNA polymerase specialized sigma24 family protein
MEQRNLKWRARAEPAQTDQLLAARYTQLLQWAHGLARGDKGKAEEIVQELCLYITLAKPDLSGVANLDGYLYTSLRHIYLSSLARASREALHLVSVEDYDSFALAISAPASGDPLQRQNDLRRICTYTIWRKESSKSASYFILHFFHGYGRQEIAEIAQLPIAAIYNKLKLARGEVVTYLEDPGKLRPVDRSSPPLPALSWTLSSAAELFQELRRSILQARHSECLTEEQLLAHYRASLRKPISCPLLAHIVSCERCLSLIDRNAKRPTLKDREPLDAFGYSSESAGGPSTSFEAMMQSVHKKWGRVHQHRPKKLSIALNGVVIANHDVRSEHNRMFARIEHPENAQFVEVFSEQHLRLALLAIGEAPPEGAATRTQRISLSDNRWLELSITFEGQGVFSEVTYLDPALAVVSTDEDAEDLPGVLPESALEPTGLRASYERLVGGLVRAAAYLGGSPAMAWALSLVTLFSCVSYLAYRSTYPALNAEDILSHSTRIQSAMLQGETEHQVVRVEESGPDGSILKQGTIELWKDGDGSRFVRRFYDTNHNLIAAEWRNKQDPGGSQGEGRNRAADSAIDQYWNQDLSAQAFAGLEDGPPRARSVDGGYELTRVGPTAAHPQLISATLVLDRHFQPVRQIMHVGAGNEVHELRFVQTSYEGVPIRSVPDTIFNPEAELQPLHGRRSSERQPHILTRQSSRQSAELEIEVLYQLSSLGADTGVPIEVLRTPDGRVRVSGTVADEAIKHAIDMRLRGLAGHELLDLRLASSREIRIPSSGANGVPAVDAYEVTQPGFAGAALIRSYYEAKGLGGQRLDEAVAQFSRDSLQHAQRALQNAYALDRLGSSLSAEELRAISLSAQKHWAEMVKSHATDLETELRTLHTELAEISYADAQHSGLNTNAMSIDDPAQFAKTASLLLHQVRELNRQVGEFFTSSGKSTSQSNPVPSLQTMMDTIPLQQAAELAEFAGRMATSADGRNSSAQTR